MACSPCCSTTSTMQEEKVAMQMENTRITRLASQLVTGQLRCDALVLDAALRQSLVTVRSLGSRGLRVAALETTDGVPAFSSRWCHQKAICPADEGTEDYLAYLEQVLDSTGA